MKHLLFLRRSSILPRRAQDIKTSKRSVGAPVSDGHVFCIKASQLEPSVSEKIWAGPSPPHLDKIQKNSNFFRETIPE